MLTINNILIEVDEHSNNGTHVNDVIAQTKLREE